MHTRGAGGAGEGIWSGTHHGSRWEAVHTGGEQSEGVDTRGAMSSSAHLESGVIQYTQSELWESVDTRGPVGSSTHLWSNGEKNGAWGRSATTCLRL